jgi:glycosyltransferase involved in cell wall biosynthesis
MTTPSPSSQEAPTTTLAELSARTCVIVPAYQAAASLGAVIDDLAETLSCERTSILVVDDGSTDDTATIAAKAGAHVVRERVNRGKGVALVRGLEEARSLKFEVALTVDADGQHPARSAAELLRASSDPRDLVLGVRDLVKDGAPPKNRFSNGVSNFFLSAFSGRPLRDTQCGLRRYPVETTLALGGRAAGYAFEAEILLRAIAGGVRIVEHPIDVVYPPEHERVTHFDSVRDPMRIIAAVLRTLVDLRRRR